MTGITPRRPGGVQNIPRPTSRRDGGAPLWADKSVGFDLKAVVDSIDRSIRDERVFRQPATDEKISAVLVLLTTGDRGTEVLLTRRSAQLENHRGEMSFPGGRVDEGESIITAALRETHEEVGVHPDLVEVRGELSALSTFVSKSYIVPIMATISAKPVMTLNTHEVERAMWVPLEELVRPDTFSWEWWSFDRPESSNERPMFFFHLEDETVWGATARILHELLCVVHGVNHVELPNW